MSDDEFGWVEGWSGRKEFGGAPEFQIAAPAAPSAPRARPVAEAAPAAPVAAPVAVAAPPVAPVVDPLSMVAALEAALAAADVAPEYGATVTLARLLARGVDSGKYQHAPKLLSVMTTLGLAPAVRPVARAAPVPASEASEPEGSAGAAVLARIRDRRAGKTVPEADPEGRPVGLPSARSSRKGSTTPRICTPPAVTGEPGPCGCGCALTPATSKGFEVVEFAHHVLGVALLPWQRWLFIHALELDLWGSYRFRTCLVLVARQNGKTTALSVLALWRMLCDGAKLVLGTSTTVDLAKEAWEKTVTLAEDTEALAGEFRFDGRGAAVRRENSSTQLLAKNKARYKTAAANRKGGRSLSVDLLILDELREHQTWAAWSASSKTTNARPNGQKWAITNQGDRTGVVLAHLRAAAMAGLGLDVQVEADADPDEVAEQLQLGDDSLFLAEWSALDKCALDDVEQWAQANPAMGYTMAEATIASDMRTDDAAVFRTEVLCQRVDLLDTAIDMDGWAAGLDEAATMESLRGKVALCVDVDPGGNHVTLVGAAVLSDGRVQAAVVDSWSGPNAVQEACAAIPVWRATIRPRAFGWYPGGPAAALAALLKNDKKATALTGEDAPAACMSLAQQILSRRIVNNGDPLLTAQLAGAGKLPVGDKWRFVRLGGPSVDGAYALAGAVQLCRILPKSLGKPQVHGVRSA
ncbi:MAG TPA: hypothetical protein VLL08_33380 [Kineosporiaceae bacterium]|nr:hypothetical protein [Kineosporiaceae bacterium]